MKCPGTACDGPGLADTPTEGIDMTNLSTDWVTFWTIRLPTGEWMAVQKNDGRTRMIPARQAAAEAAVMRPVEARV